MHPLDILDRALTIAFRIGWVLTEPLFMLLRCIHFCVDKWRKAR